MDVGSSHVRDHSYHPEDTRLAHGVHPDDRSYLESHRHDLLSQVPHTKLILPITQEASFIGHHPSLDLKDETLSSHHFDHETEKHTYQPKEQQHVKWVDEKLAR